MAPFYPSSIIDKRVASLEHLSSINTTKLSRLHNATFIAGKDFEQIFKSETLTTLHYFYLGGSIPLIMQRYSHSLPEYLKAFLSLLKEYETLKSQSESSTSRAKSVVGVGRRLFRSRVKSETSISTSDYHHLQHHHSILRAGRNSSGSIPSSLPFSFIPSPMSSEFSYLYICHLPFIPDFTQTFLCLCEVLISAYKHIDELLQTWPVVSQDVQDLLVKVDDKVYKHIIGPTLKDAETPFRNISFSESPTSKLSSLLSRA